MSRRARKEEISLRVGNRVPIQTSFDLRITFWSTFSTRRSTIKPRLCRWRLERTFQSEMEQAPMVLERPSGLFWVRLETVGERVGAWCHGRSCRDVELRDDAMAEEIVR